MPRSGTAFVSAVLNLHPDCFCVHEPAAEPGWRTKLAAISLFRYVAISDTVCGRYPEFTLPHARCVYLRRPFEDSLKAINKIRQMGREKLEEVVRYNEKWAAERRALIIDNPFTLKNLTEIWRHVFPERIQQEQAMKLERFVTLNIQHHNPKGTWSDNFYPD